MHSLQKKKLSAWYNHPPTEKALLEGAARHLARGYPLKMTVEMSNLNQGQYFNSQVVGNPSGILGNQAECSGVEYSNHNTLICVEIICNLGITSLHFATSGCSWGLIQKCERNGHWGIFLCSSQKKPHVPTCFTFLKSSCIVSDVCIFRISCAISGAAPSSSAFTY